MARKLKSTNSIKEYNIEQLENDFIRDCKIRGLSDITIRGYKTNIGYFKKYLEKFGYKGSVSINCALKEDFKIDNGCNMLTERKVGLDQFGNLYTCIWASDLLIEKNDNPFYLGNLTECSLLEILSSLELKGQLDKINQSRNKCYVLEFYNKRQCK